MQWATGPAFGQDAAYVGATRQWIFAFDEDLNLIWRKNNTGFSVVGQNDDVALLVTPSGGRPKAMGLARSDGRMLWSAVLAGPVMQAEMKGRTAIVSSDVGKKLRNEEFVLSTGDVRSVHTVLDTVSPDSVSICQLPQPPDTLDFVVTSKYVCTVGRNLSVTWKVPLNRGESGAAAHGGTMILKARHAVRAIRKSDGRQLWSKSYSGEVVEVSAGPATVFRFADGTQDSVDTQTGRSLRPR